MRDAVMAHPKARRLLEFGEAEQSMVAEFEGVRVRSRPDNAPRVALPPVDQGLGVFGDDRLERGDFHAPAGDQYPGQVIAGCESVDLVQPVGERAIRPLRHRALPFSPSNGVMERIAEQAGTGGNVYLSVTNPVTEPTSRTIERTSTLLALRGSI